MNNGVVVLVDDDELGGVEEHDDGAGEPTTSLHRVPWRRQTDQRHWVEFLKNLEKVGIAFFQKPTEALAQWN